MWKREQQRERERETVCVCTGEKVCEEEKVYMNLARENASHDSSSLVSTAYLSSSSSSANTSSSEGFIPDSADFGALTVVESNSRELTET